MPFYEYQCSHCGHFFEALQKISEAPLRKCPSCGKSALKKLVSAPVFRLKGSGWYETDFKSNQEQKRNLAGAEKDAGDSSASAENKTKGESESAGKTDAKPPAAGDSAPAKPAETKPAANARTGNTRAPRAGARSGGAARPSKRAGTTGRSRVSSSRARSKRGRR